MANPLAPDGYRIVSDENHIFGKEDRANSVHNRPHAIGWIHFGDLVGKSLKQINNPDFDYATPIVEKIMNPPTLPSDFKFVMGKNEQPLYQKPKDGEWFVKYDHISQKYGQIVQAKNFLVPYGAEERRFIVEKIEFPVSPPKTLLDGYEWPNGKIEFRVPKDGDYYLPMAISYDFEVLGQNVSRSKGEDTVRAKYDGKRFIVVKKAEFPVNPPTTIMDGYEWPNGKVEFRVPKKGEYYLPMVNSDHIKNLGKYVYACGSDTESNIDKYEGKRFIVVKKNHEIEEDNNEWVEITDLDHIDRPDIDEWSRDGLKWSKTNWSTNVMPLGELRKTYSNAKYRCKKRDLPKVKEVWVEITDLDHIARKDVDWYNNSDTYSVWEPVRGVNGRSLGSIRKDNPNAKLRCLSKDLPEKVKGYASVSRDPLQYVSKSLFGPFAEHSIMRVETKSDVSSSDITSAGAVAPKKDEEDMKKETAIKVATTTAKITGNALWKVTNYLFLETAMNIGRPIVRSVRYAVFLGTIGTAIYGYNNPEVVKNAVKSCIPKITIEAPEIMK